MWILYFTLFTLAVIGFAVTWLALLAIGVNGMQAVSDTPTVIHENAIVEEVVGVSVPAGPRMDIPRKHPLLRTRNARSLS